MNSLVCLAIVCVSLIVNIQAFQHNRKTGDLRMRFGPQGPQPYCFEMDKNKEWAINEKTMEDCFECECSIANNGILCVGVGYQDGVAPPQGCMKRHLQDFEMQAGEKCCYQMVSTSNQADVCGDKVCA